MRRTSSSRRSRIRAKIRIRFTRSARHQFLAALAYIHRDSPSAAVMFRRKTEQALRRLQQVPQSGHVIPEFPELPHREVRVVSYRLFYRLVGRAIWVIGFWHGAQQPDEEA
ncbi:MAG: type II toxin-antitoxin system RelE/ParE family toxin [Myxococcaceae bacterium]